MTTWFTTEPPEEGLYRTFEEIRDEARGVVMFVERVQLWEGRWVTRGGYTYIRGWQHWPEPSNQTDEPPAI